MARVKLEKFIKEKKISKRQFARELGIAYPNVFRLFRADYDPKLSTIAQWARILRMKISELIEE